MFDVDTDDDLSDGDDDWLDRDLHEDYNWVVDVTKVAARRKRIQVLVYVLKFKIS